MTSQKVVQWLARYLETTSSTYKGKQRNRLEGSDLRLDEFSFQVAKLIPRYILTAIVPLLYRSLIPSKSMASFCLRFEASLNAHCRICIFSIIFHTLINSSSKLQRFGTSPGTAFRYSSKKALGSDSNSVKAARTHLPINSYKIF